MNKKTFVAVLVGVGLVLGTWAWAQQSGQGQQPMGPMDQGGMMGQQGGMGQGGQPGPGMGPGMMMGEGQHREQAQQPGSPMGPGMMGPGMMGSGGHMGAGMMGGMMGAGSANDRPWITYMLDHREELGLSAEQIGRLFTLRDTYMKEARKKSEGLQKVERDIDQSLGPGPVDLRAVEARLKGAEAIRTDLRLSHTKVIEEGKAVLTPEQRAKFAELAKQRQRSSEGTSHAHSMAATPGMEEMHRFMHSERGAAAMIAMMEMARRMGNGDAMLGMVRMMEMMGNMGGMMGMPGQPAPAKQE